MSRVLCVCVRKIFPSLISIVFAQGRKCNGHMCNNFRFAARNFCLHRCTFPNILRHVSIYGRVFVMIDDGGGEVTESAVRGCFSGRDFRDRAAYPRREDSVVCTHDNGLPPLGRHSTSPFWILGTDLERRVCRKLARGLLLSTRKPKERLYLRGSARPSILARCVESYVNVN